MITAADLQFHTPPDVDHEWAETYWLGFYVPQANLYGWVYMVFRAGPGVVTCDVEVIDRRSPFMYDARYVDIQNHLVIPDRLDQFTLANGLRFAAASPREYRLDYVGVNETELHLDLVGIHEPFDIHDPAIDPMARADAAEAARHSGFGSAYANHFDLTTRVTGTLVLRGETHSVDCLATQDHSWGPRPERGMRTMAYMNAHFGLDGVVQTIFDFDPSQPDGAQHRFKHGYVVTGGELTGLIDASLRVDHQGIFPTSVQLSARDVAGDEHELSATPLAFHHWVPYGICPTAHSMLAWRTPAGREGIGTLMEAYPLGAVCDGVLHDDIRLSAGRALGAQRDAAPAQPAYRASISGP